MGDMGDFYRDLDSYNKERRAGNVRAAKESPIMERFTEKGANHFQATVAGKTLSWWPPSNKWQYGGKMYRGKPDALAGFIRNREEGN
jgi:hypothetical protein